MTSTSTERLVGVRAKMERAKAHVRDIEARMGTYLYTGFHPYSFASEDDPNTGEKVYRVRIRSPIPDSVPLIIGDAVHNLRSALDHLAWQLVEANGQTPDHLTSYPICDRPERFHSPPSQRKVQGVAPAVLPLIEATQPYQSGYGGIGILNELDNFDKHRLLIVAAVQFGTVTFGSRGDPILSPQRRTGEGRVAMFNVPMPFAAGLPILQDGDELYRMPQADRGKHQAHIEFAIEAALREPKVVQGLPVLPLLAQLTQLVEGVVKQFVPFL